MTNRAHFPAWGYIPAKFRPRASGFHLRAPVPVQHPSMLHCAIVNAVLATNYYRQNDTNPVIPAVFAEVPAWCMQYLGYVPRPVFLGSTPLTETGYAKRSTHNAAWERESRHLEFRCATDGFKWMSQFPDFAHEADDHEEDCCFRESEREFKGGWEWHAIRYGEKNPDDCTEILDCWSPMPLEEWAIMPYTAQYRSTDAFREVSFTA